MNLRSYKSLQSSPFSNPVLWQWVMAIIHPGRGHSRGGKILRAASTESTRVKTPFICPGSIHTLVHHLCRSQSCTHPKAPQEWVKDSPGLPSDYSTRWVQNLDLKKSFKSANHWGWRYTLWKELGETAIISGENCAVTRVQVYSGNISELPGSSDFQWGCVDPVCLQHR